MKERKLSVISKMTVWLLFVILVLAMGLLLPADTVSADGPAPASGLGEFTKWNTVTVSTANGDMKKIKKAPKGNSKLGSSLNQLLETSRSEGLAEAHTFSRSHNMVIEDDRVQVTVVTTEGAVDKVRGALENLGGSYQLHYKNLVQALLPIGKLEVLAQRLDVLIIREPRRAVPEPALPQAVRVPVPEVGTQSTEGVGASNASAWHAAGYDGTGVRVAVIDAGFEGYTGLLGTDLPGSVTTYDWTGTGMGGTVHGTGCAEVVYDMAYGATMDLHKVGTEVEVGNAVDNAIADGVDIITMSLGWPMGGPGDGTGDLADIVKEARANGIFYAKSAGNNAEVSWSGTFTDTNADDYHEWVSGEGNVNCFGSGNGSCYIIPAGSPIYVGLHWDDWTAVNQDYELYLFYWNGSTWVLEDSSENYQNGGAGQTPLESISVSASSTAPYAVVVKKWDATRDVCLHLVAQGMGHLDKWVPERSISFPGDSPDAITVGAVDVSSPYPLDRLSVRAALAPGAQPNQTSQPTLMYPRLATAQGSSTAPRRPRPTWQGLLPWSRMPMATP